MTASVTQVQERALAILKANGLPGELHGEHYDVRFASTVVRIGFIKYGMQVIISVRAPVLSGVELGGGNRKRILKELNRLNRETHFGKWLLDIDMRVIALEYDLLGDHLQEDELMTAVMSIARLADQADDEFERRLGGERAFED